MSSNSFASDPHARNLQLPGGRVVPAASIGWRATTSGGPGGQHANRTASRVSVFVRIEDLPLEPREKQLLYERLASRLTGAGEITVSIGEHRSQLRNRAVAIRRLEQLLNRALRVQKARIPTKQSYGSKLRARKTKQRNSDLKRSRNKHWDDHAS